jgi:hypothetical protein
MPTDLRTALSALANEFAESLLAAFRSASIQELVDGGWLVVGGHTPPAAPSRPSAPRPQPAGHPRVVRSNGPVAPRAAPHPPSVDRAPAKKPSGPLKRRTPAEIIADLERVVAVVRKSTGLRSEQIQKALGLDKREMPRILAMGVAGKRLLRKGQRRSTMYSWNAASATAPTAPKKK